ncbi:MAG: hypothetical protein ABSH32_20755, partial [Bryobacteraceae bacterium]
QGSLSSLSPALCGCGTSGSTRIAGAATTGTHSWPEKRPASMYSISFGGVGPSGMARLYELRRVVFTEDGALRLDTWRQN